MKKDLGFESNGDSAEADLQVRLSRVAATFALSVNSKFKEAAYRMAVSIEGLRPGMNYDGNGFAELILSRLGNFPTIQAFLPESDNLPIQLFLESRSHRLENTVTDDVVGQFVMTDFQTKLWTKLSEEVAITTVVAPTSAGKSFALQRYLLREFSRNRNSWFLYVVPSRALINQVSEEFAKLLRAHNLSDFSILSTPASPADLGVPGGLFVLTQERLQTLLEADPALLFRMVVVDEAQMISDSDRGILLQTAIEKVRSRSASTRCLFGCPFIRNPELFRHVFREAIASANFIDEDYSPVSQNVVFLATDSSARQSVKFSTFISGGELFVGSRHFSSEPSFDLSDANNRLAFLAWKVGGTDPSIIYAGGPARCEDIAATLADLKVPTDVSPTIAPELTEFASFLREQIHPEYILAKVVERGVGFHYGKVPSVVRKTVEDLFREGKLRQLVSTSTLLHGVNLPAKNLFMLNPTKGKEWGEPTETPLTPSEFWNLAGRAGRLGKEYEGNVFLVDYDSWTQKPLDAEKKQEIRSSFADNLLTRGPELVGYMKDPEHASGQAEGVEGAFMKLYNSSKAGRLREVLEATGVTFVQAKPIIDSLAEISRSITVPDEIADRNSMVSVVRQQELLNYLEKRFREKGAAYLAPTHPQARDAYQGMLRFFKRIHNHLEKLPKSDGSHKFYANWAVAWMRGKPLAELIALRIKYKQDHAVRGVNIHTTIREVMRLIEDDLRFRYVKFAKCHNDLLAHVYRSNGAEEYIEKIPAIPLYLEFGASSDTMMNLVSLGISRTTANIVAAKLPDELVSRAAVLSWLRLGEWRRLDISSICKRELERHLVGTT
ncbi:MAG: DEAD/DEAH box helicase [Bdellovibrionaceae bacterium]|nr:DEAD/DEAH box helicase [Pseudobdellovibrionaceae bacterium]